MKQNEIKVESINIGLASPIRIRKWAERMLPNGQKVGEVATSQTLNYKTLKPEPGGLFCEKTFGPVKSFECSCGTFDNTKNRFKYCPNCDVQFTDSRIRRYRLGYIELASPVTHIWYLKGRPSFIPIILGLSQKEQAQTRKAVQAVVYCRHPMYIPILKLFKIENTTKISNFLVTQNNTDKQSFSNSSIENTKQIYILKKYFSIKFKEKFNIKNIFKTQFTTIFNNSYYSDMNKIEFQSLQYLKFKKNTNISFFEKRTVNFKHKKNIKKKKIKELHLNKNFFSKSTLNSDKVESKNIFSLAHKKIFLNSTVQLKKNRPNTKQILSKNSFLSNLQSQNFLKFFQSKNNTAFQCGKLSKNSTLKPQPIINPYYPICSHYMGKIKSEYTPNAQDKWKRLSVYITSMPADSDILLPIYSYRVSNQLIKINNTYYKSIPSLVSDTEAIWYLLKTLNGLPVILRLRKQISILDREINEFRQYKFLYLFEEKKLRKLLKLRFENVRRFKIVRYFQKNNLHFEWLILSILPVLPPELRPIVQLDANQVAVSDLNQLYKRVLDRNKRLKSYQTNNFSPYSYEIKYNQRLLQEAVDALIENGKGGTPVAAALNGRAFKSLSDILKGKKGRFRQNLLGKRVDYSGRSVIVVAPELKLHQCGLPKEMAIELFHSFILRELTTSKDKMPGGTAKKIIREQKPIIWRILRKILKTHPILLNRAPTLHRLGIQAFQPKLIEGRAILLHPLVCTAFNADFDGDQMAVHVPLSAQARAEAWQLMWSRNNILSPATGQPIIVPSQDMVLGCYYLTTNLHDSVVSVTKYQKLKQQVVPIFSNIDDVLIAFHQNKISLHSLILLRSINLIQIENFYEKPIEIHINFFGKSTQIYSKYWRNLDNQSNKISHFMYTTTGRVLLNEIIFQSVTKQSDIKQSTKLI